MAKLHYHESPTPSEKSSFAPFLSEDEELILVTGLGKAYMRSKFIMYMLWPGIIFALSGVAIGWFLHLSQAITALLSIFLVGVGSVMMAMHHYHAHRYLLTTRRVIIKKGVFSVNLTTAMYDKITQLEVEQGFFDRLFLHHGNIIVSTAGMSKGNLNLEFVDYPLELKNLMERLINREREQFGLRGGTVTAVEGELVS